MHKTTYKFLKTSFFLFILIATFSCKFSDKTDANNLGPEFINSPASAAEGSDKNIEKMPVFEFEFDKYDFGKLAQGEKKSVMFKFKNVGKSNLLITSVTASCGCTVSKNWPKKPIEPNESGEIEVTFDSEGLRGHQFKNVSILANSYPATTLLNITAEVIAPEVF